MIAGALAVGLALMGGGRQPPSDGPSLLRAENGAQLKLIVRRAGALREEPLREAASEPAAPFEFFYAYDPGPLNSRDGKTVQGHYFVGRTAPRGVPVGWLGQDDVVEWPHRQALAFSPQQGRAKALFYASLSDLAAVERGEAPPRDKAISEEPEVVGRALLPILEEASVERPGEQPLRAYRVAYLSEAPKVAPQRAAQLKAGIGLDVAFVIDATGSMQPWIDRALAASRQVAQKVAGLPALKGRVRFALVCFRDGREDYAPADFRPKDDYVVRAPCDLEAGADHRAFLTALDAVVAEGGGQTPERVLDGLATAIEDLAWAPFAYKHVVLIGNASAHEGPGLGAGRTIDQIKLLAQPAGSLDEPERAITLHALQVPSKDPKDSAKAREQFSELARGERYPGLFVSETDLDAFQAQLIDLVQGRLKYVDELSRGAAASSVARSAASDRLIGPLLSMINAGAIGDGFVSAYVAETDRAGNRQVEPQLLVRRGQLELFEAGINALVVAVEGSGEPGARDLGAVLTELKRLAVGLQLGEVISPETPARRVLQMVLDVPVRGALFDVTPRRLAAMSADEFQEWKAQAADCRRKLREQVEDPRRWFDLGRASRPDQQVSFVRLADLP